MAVKTEDKRPPHPSAALDLREEREAWPPPGPKTSPAARASPRGRSITARGREGIARLWHCGRHASPQLENDELRK